MASFSHCTVKIGLHKKIFSLTNQNLEKYLAGVTNNNAHRRFLARGLMWIVCDFVCFGCQIPQTFSAGANYGEEEN